MRIIGIEDAEEHGGCDCCDKQAGPELKSLVVLQDSNGGISKMGCVCAARALGFTSGDEVGQTAK